jgi:ribonuclease BN (tRNA processing enzyme)
MSVITVRFWGVRGSVPAPLTPAQVEDKVVDAVEAALTSDELFDRPATTESIRAWVRGNLGFSERSTYGGNTTCVEVRCGDALIILDMGTGLRELGLGLLGETIKNKGLKGTIFQSHVHWDHIQGYPFWSQLYMPRERFDNRFDFYGGRGWDASLEEVLRGQMNPPVFPVDHRELEETSLKMKFATVFDGMRVELKDGAGNPIVVTARKLNHPQETYGYRIEYLGKVVTFCTDHEPYAGREPHRGLVDLARGADLFITDCQYTHDEYAGVGGKVQKFGWGHSFPEYIAQVADAAKAKKVITTHHDPQASDRRIEEIASAVEKMSSVATVPAYEGLVLNTE